MMELNDNEFDATFRKKVFDAEPQFEEAAWNKMEQKLKRRDRLVFFRKATALSLLLLFAIGGYYSLFITEPKLVKPSIVKENNGQSELKPEVKKPLRSAKLSDRSTTQSKQIIAHRDYEHGNTFKSTKLGYLNESQQQALITNKTVSPMDSIYVKNSTSNVNILPDVVKQDSNIVASPGSEVEPAAVTSIVGRKKSKQRNPRPVSLSLSLGPEFNSSSSLIGGKKGFSAGIGFSVGIAKKVKLQTGLKYSMKDYGTDGYDYTFHSEKAKRIVTHVDASCAVLEIPLQASLTVMEDNNRSIDLNAGMSSYFMLKEDYTFKYTAESGYKDKLQEFNNKNQHYFGVIDLSATYYMKLKKEKVSIGLEPYIKIPVTGVGEGKVNLKSSGVALKLRYDLGKNNK